MLHAVAVPHSLHVCCNPALSGCLPSWCECRSKQKEVLEAVSAQAEELQRKVDEQEMQVRGRGGKRGVGRGNMATWTVSVQHCA
jgi:hypothetical protein